MRAARILSVAIALLLTGSALSFGAELTQVVRTLEQGYGTLNDLEATFNQKSTLKTMKREEKGGGVLYIKKGSGRDAMFRFDYTKPKQQIISNGKTVWYYIPEQKQVMVMEVAELFAEGSSGVALNYLAGMGHVSKDFDISFAGQEKDKKGNYQLDLVPKKKSAAMAKLQLVIDGEAVEEFVERGRASKPFPILASTVFDQAGNSTRMEFSKVKTNRGMESGRFNFKIPAGVEVVKR